MPIDSELRRGNASEREIHITDDSILLKDSLLLLEECWNLFCKLYCS